MITLVLVDDHRMMREGLKVLLQSQGDVQVVGEASDGRTALRAAKDLAPDIVVLDVAMPSLNGIDACRQITAETSARVVALSMHDDREYVAAMLQAGAMAYVLKDCAPEELLAAVRSVANGSRFLCSPLMDVVLADYADKLRDAEEPPAGGLTPRQREVLQLLAEGRTTRDIAAALHLSARTVEGHRAELMKQLGCGSLAELVKYAIRHGLTDVSR